jgi:hypothetical protein
VYSINCKLNNCIVLVETFFMFFLFAGLMVDVFCDTFGDDRPAALTRCKAVFAVLSIRVADLNLG